MRKVSDLKGGGYLVSTGSVVLLGIPAMKSASENRWMLASLIAGMVLSICGMMLRWRSHRLDQQDKDRERTAR